MRARRIGKVVPVVLATASVAAGGVALAAGSSGSVTPGKGCGDNNHVHYKQDSCKKPPHGPHPPNKHPTRGAHAQKK